jgi:hypothetical protein
MEVLQGIRPQKKVVKKEDKFRRLWNVPRREIAFSANLLQK